MARHDLRDPYALPDDPRDWRDGIEDGVAEMRVAVLRRPGFDAPVDWESIAAVEQAARLLMEAGAEVEEADPGLPDTSGIFGRIWGVALARLVNSFPETRRHMLDPGLLQVAAAAGGLSAIEYLDGEAMRVAAAHAMARFHQQYDLVLCPTVPATAPLADAPLGDPVQALWTDWAPWTFAFNLTRQPAISVPMGFAANGLPRAVQLAGPIYRDDIVLRAARTLEVAQPFAMPELE
jgi:aspartyl-tRNA(Asn)/glutamyl-tRNA(Gln) amidotransferase subunit A